MKDRAPSFLMGTSNRAAFTVSYGGAALETHAMDVRDLGPALMSLGQLFDEANRILNGDKVFIKVQVKAHTQGSFEICLEAVQSLSSQLSGFLTGDVVTSALNLKELIFLGSGSLYWLIKKLKGGKPKKITNLENSYIRIENDTETFEISLKLLRLYQDVAVRTAAEKTLQPLKNDGVDVFIIKDKGQERERIDKSESAFFLVPKVEDEQLVETEHESAYSIVSLTFKADNKWRLYDGNSAINATIKDEAFLKKVDENRVSFAKGDILLCKMKTRQYKANGELKAEHEVLEVKEHQPAARQLLMFEDNSDSLS